MDYFNNKRNLLLAGLVCLEYVAAIILSVLMKESLQNTWLSACALVAVFLTLCISFWLYARDLKAEKKENKAIKFKIASYFFLAGTIIAVITAMIKIYEKLFV